MKAQNAVVGGKVQIKRDCRGHSGEVITKGLVCAVTRVHVRDSDYELRLKHPAIAEGYAWVNASDCRKYIEPVVDIVEDTPVLPSHNYQEGDKVLVGAKGAGYGLVEKAYANLVCTVSDTRCTGDSVNIKHPDVMSDMEYTTKLQYITPYTGEPTEPVQLTCADVQVGDWLVYNHGGYELQEGVAYEVVESVDDEGSIIVANHTSADVTWQGRFYTRVRYFNKVLREVTPRG